MMKLTTMQLCNTMTFVSYFVFVDAEKFKSFPVKMGCFVTRISAGCLELFLKTSLQIIQLGWRQEQGEYVSKFEIILIKGPLLTE